MNKNLIIWLILGCIKADLFRTLYKEWSSWKEKLKSIVIVMKKEETKWGCLEKQYLEVKE